MFLLTREQYMPAAHLCTNYKLTGLTFINSELIALTAAGDQFYLHGLHQPLGSTNSWNRPDWTIPNPQTVLRTRPNQIHRILRNGLNTKSYKMHASSTPPEMCYFSMAVLYCVCFNLLSSEKDRASID